MTRQDCRFEGKNTRMVKVSSPYVISGHVTSHGAVILVLVVGQDSFYQVIFALKDPFTFFMIV